MTASVQFYALAYSGEDEQPLDATSDERAPRELTAIRPSYEVVKSVARSGDRFIPPSEGGGSTAALST
jgi:hypothetical protein